MLIPLVLLAGCVGGGIWGAIPGLFKAYRKANEVLSTIMLNLVAVQLMGYLLAGPMIDKSESFAVVGRIPQTKLLSPNSWLPIIVPGTQLHLGAVIAVLVAVAVYVLLRRTGFGFRIRAVGYPRCVEVRRDGCQADHRHGPHPVRRDVRPGRAMLVFGSISHRMVTDGTLTGFTGSDGYYGIVVALFGGLNPLWTILSAFLFGGLLVGGRLDGHRAERALLIGPGHHDRRSHRLLRRLARCCPAAVDAAGRTKQPAPTADHALAAARSRQFRAGPQPVRRRHQLAGSGGNIS